MRKTYDLPPGVFLAGDERLLDVRKLSPATYLFFLHADLVTTDRRVIARFWNFGVFSVRADSPLVNVASVRLQNSLSPIVAIVAGLMSMTALWRNDVAPAIAAVALWLLALRTEIVIAHTGSGAIRTGVALWERASAAEFAQGLSAVLAGLPTTVSTSGFTPPSSGPGGPVLDRLEELGRLLDTGEITLDEYQRRRGRVISGL